VVGVALVAACLSDDSESDERHRAWPADAIGAVEVMFAARRLRVFLPKDSAVRENVIERLMMDR